LPGNRSRRPRAHSQRSSLPAGSFSAVPLPNIVPARGYSETSRRTRALTPSRHIARPGALFTALPPQRPVSLAGLAGRSLWQQRPPDLLRTPPLIRSLSNRVLKEVFGRLRSPMMEVAHLDAVVVQPVIILFESDHPWLWAVADKSPVQGCFTAGVIPHPGRRYRRCKLLAKHAGPVDTVPDTGFRHRSRVSCLIRPISHRGCCLEPFAYQRSQNGY
jgi:hypothetical protein